MVLKRVRMESIFRRSGIVSDAPTRISRVLEIKQEIPGYGIFPMETFGCQPIGSEKGQTESYRVLTPGEETR